MMDYEVSCFCLFEAVQCRHWQLCGLPPTAGTAGWVHEHSTMQRDRQSGNHDNGFWSKSQKDPNAECQTWSPFVMAALWPKLQRWSAMGSHGGFVFGLHGRAGDPLSVPEPPNHPKQTAVEVHQGKAVHSMLLRVACKHVSLTDSVNLFVHHSVQRPARSSTVPVVSGGCEGGGAGTDQRWSARRSQRPHKGRRSVPAPLHTSPQTTVAFWATRGS